jgi:hypothetical protein
MHWMKALALLAAVSMLAAPVPTYANMTAAVTQQDYAAREAQAADLEGFTGGWHGVVLTVFLIVVLVWLWFEVIEPHYHGHEPAHKPHGPVHP